MGSYLNSKKACLLYQDETEETYFVDKTAILDELIPLIEQRDNTTQKGKATNISALPALAASANRLWQV